MTGPADSTRGPEQVDNLAELYEAIAPHSLQALWSISLLYPEPRTAARPMAQHRIGLAHGRRSDRYDAG